MTKNEKDIELLQKSIVEKWIPIWKGEEEDKGGTNCSLCQFYTHCSNCPLFNIEEDGCKVYDDWHYHQVDDHAINHETNFAIHRWCPECKRLAAEMVGKLRRMRDALALEEERKEEKI